jgi:hypothetical protein
MGSPMMGSGNVVLPLYGPKKVKENKLIVDPPKPGSKKVTPAPKQQKKVTPNKLRVDPPAGLQPNRLVLKTSSPKLNSYTPIKKTLQVNKVYKTY